jgi:hypothetical protein
MSDLTARQREVLHDVEHAGFDEGEWFTPMMVGGRNGSDHSAILRQLVRKGYLEAVKHPPRAYRGVYRYRLVP